MVDLNPFAGFITTGLSIISSGLFHSLESTTHSLIETPGLLIDEK